MGASSKGGFGFDPVKYEGSGGGSLDFPNPVSQPHREYYKPAQVWIKVCGEQHLVT